MKGAVFIPSLLFAAVAMQPVWAQETPQAGAHAATSAAATDSAPAAVAPAVPKLNITWDCGDCEHNDKVIPLIEQAYAAEAKRNALSVSETDVAEVAITDIRQRPPGVRVMFGFMAGKDRLGVRISYLGQEYFLSDTSANAIMGLDHLSESIGKKACAELARKPTQQI